MHQIKQYEIIEILGRGGMGEVFKAFDSILEREVAIKIMHPHLLNNEINDKRFMNEARVAAKLVHPNIVTIHEIGKFDAGRFIVMEYVQGKLLRELLQEDGFFPMERMIDLASQTLSALQFAHNLKVLHRDIKTDNILITDEDKVKILDFGIAKIATNEGLTIAGDILGTVEYMSPEQLMGESVDHRSDIYAFGVVLYQILTKHLPFDAESPAALLYKKLNEEPMPPSYYNPKISKKLDKVVSKAICSNVKERWKTAEEFSKALNNSLISKKQKVVSFDEDFSNLISGLETDSEVSEPDQLRTTFVGRDKDLKKLIHIFSKVSRGEGKTAIIMGEAGVGKTTLSSNLQKYVKHHKAIVLYGACLYQEGMDPYLPYIDAFKEYFSNDSQTLPEEDRIKLKEVVRERVPLLMEFTERFTTTFGAKPVNQLYGSDPDNNKIFEGIYHLISLLSNIQPVLLILDDLQWADRASLRLFHYLSKYITHNRVMLLGISRSDRYDLQKNGNPSEFLDVIARIRREGILEELNLSKLDKKSCEKLVDNSLIRTTFSDDFYKEIYNGTEGNPFFVLETLKLLRDNNQIFLEDGAWHEKESHLTIQVPNRVEDVFIRRLNDLNEEKREVLQVAAVHGYKFDISVLAVIMEIRRINLLKMLQNVQHNLQIVTNTEHGFQFEHPMLRDLLYNEIPIVLRQEYHLMIAEELEKMYSPNLGAIVGEVAQHYRLGGNHKKAIPFLYQAAERSFNISAFKETSLYFENLLDSLNSLEQSLPEDISSCTLYFKLGISYEECGRWEKGIEAYQKLLEASNEQANIKGQIDAQLRMGRINGKLGNWEKSLSCYEECLKIAEEHSFPNVRSRIFNNFGVIHFQQGDLNQASTYFEKTLKESLDNKKGEFDWAHALTNLGIIANIRGEHHAALENYKQALSIYEKFGNRNQDLARVYHNIGMTHSDMKEWEESNIAYKHCLKLAEEVEDKQLKAMTLLNMGKTYTAQKNFRKAEELTKKAMKFFKRSGDVLNEAEGYHIFGLIKVEQGDFTSAEKLFMESIRINQKMEYWEGLAETYICYGDLCKIQELHKQAKDNYQKAIDIFTKLCLSNKIDEVKKKLESIDLIKEAVVNEIV